MEGTYIEDPTGESSWQGQGTYGLASGDAAMHMNSGGFTQADHEEHEKSGDGYEEEPAPKPISKSRVPIYTGMIQDEFHYERLRTQRIEQETSAKMGNVTMPTSARMKECARLLFEAITNVEGIVDKTCKGGKICQAGARILAGYYPGEAIEMVVWEIIMACRISAMGIPQVASHHLAKFEFEHEGFEERITQIIDTCRVSKAACKQLLDPLFVHRLADAPVHELKAKNQNKKINTQRDKQNVVGREMIKMLQDTFGIEGVEDGAELQLDSPVISTPRKSTRTTRNRAATLKTPAPLVTSPVTMSTSKRKAFGSMSLRDDDEEEKADNDDDEYLDTPTKSKRARISLRTQRDLSLKIDNASVKISPEVLTHFHNINNSRDEHVVRKSSRRQSSLSLAKELKTSTSSSGDLSSFTNARIAGEMAYKNAICDLLNVPRQFANTMSLHKLRFYARVYNTEFADKIWVFSEEDTKLTGSEVRGIGHKIMINGNLVQNSHFALMIDGFRDLAVARGDLNQDSSVNEESIGKNCIDVRQNPEMLKVLALGPKSNFRMENPTFGLPDSGSSPGTGFSGHHGHGSASTLGDPFVNGNSSTSGPNFGEQKASNIGYGMSSMQSNSGHHQQSQSSFIDPNLASGYNSGNFDAGFNAQGFMSPGVTGGFNNDYFATAPTMYQGTPLNTYGFSNNNYGNEAYSYSGQDATLMDYNGGYDMDGDAMALATGVNMSMNMGGFSQGGVQRSLPGSSFPGNMQNTYGGPLVSVYDQLGSAGGDSLSELDRRPSDGSTDPSSLNANLNGSPDGPSAGGI